MTLFDKHTDDPVRQKIDQLKTLHAVGTRLNTGTVWRLTLDISRFGETATICLFRKTDTSGQAIMQTTVNIRPEQPLTSELEHQNFQNNLREHLNGLIALVQHLTSANAPSPNPVTEQNNLIGVIDK